MLKEVVHSNAKQDSEKRVYKASKILQYKAGFGEIDHKHIDAAQNVIDQVQFEPIALKILKELEDLIHQHNGEDVECRELIDELAAPVMQLKASASMFGYPIVSKLTNIMFSFLNQITVMDKVALQIIDGHHKTLVGIVNNKIKDDTNDYAIQLERELYAACERYMLKNENNFVM